MATTKKSSSSKKASTTKKAAKKPAKKTTAARSAKKTTTKKSSSSKKASTTKKSSSAKATTATAAKTVKTSTKKEAKKSDSKLDKLNLWNWVLAALHAIQGFAIIFLSKSDSLFPVTTNFVTVDELASSEGAPVLVEAQRSLFDINLAYLVAAFFFLSALAHLYIATIGRKRYETQLGKGMNKARWYEYSLSASVMMVAIAMLSGVSDLSTLVMLFGATSVMNLCGLVMEVHNQTTSKTNWISYVVGTISGLLPWVVVGIYFWGAEQYGSGGIPTFVYWIYASIFVFFSSFAVNMWLQYRGKGRWQDYLYGEKVYMVLSLIAKSALAWQIFAGTLRP